MQASVRKPRYPRTRPAGVLLAVALIAFSLSGCFKDIVIDVPSLERSSESTIIVLTRDGWLYKFPSGEYTVTADSNLGQILQGHAKKYKRFEPDFINFHGAIPLEAIERVTVEEATPWLYVSLGTIALVTAAVIWFAVSLHGVNAG